MADVSKNNAARPFCSQRCKMLDLDRWFSGGYRIPGPSVPTSELPGLHEETYASSESEIPAEEET
jgi:endogenous inhibitor of DNA gyrase (YacG/DUF329 family)